MAQLLFSIMRVANWILSSLREIVRSFANVLGFSVNRVIYVVFLIIVGELLTIVAELGAIKMEELGFGFWIPVILMTGVYFLSGCCLLPAYALSERVFRSTWTTAALTIGAVLILEPLIIVLFFSEVPSTTSLIGFIFGVVGLGNSLYDTARTAGD